MPKFTILPDTNQHTLPKDFGVKIVGTQLLVPMELAVVLKQLSIRDFEGFVSYLYTFPTAIAVGLNWKLSDVLFARQTLTDKFANIIHSELIHPHFQRGYGVQ